MLNEISKTDAGFKKGGMNFTLVLKPGLITQEIVLVEGKMMRS